MKVKGPSHDLSRVNVRTLEVQGAPDFSMGCSGDGISYLNPSFEIRMTVGAKEVISDSGYSHEIAVRLALDFSTWEEINDFARKAFFMGQCARRYQRRMGAMEAPEGWKVCTACEGKGMTVGRLYSTHEESCKTCEGKGEISK